MTDAWKQLDDLRTKYTTETEIRPNLIVTALGLERTVRLTFVETDTRVGEADKRRRRYHSTQRNVSTMRELAEAILEACYFVECANPEWAQKI